MALSKDSTLNHARDPYYHNTRYPPDLSHIGLSAFLHELWQMFLISQKDMNPACLCTDEDSSRPEHGPPI